MQVKQDDDMVNRYIAFYKLADKEKMNLLKGGEVSEDFMELYHSIFSDKELLNEMSTLMLAITEGVEDVEYTHKYEEIYQIREKLLKAIASKYKDDLLKLYDEYNVTKTDGTYVENQVFDIKKRSVKNVALALLTRLDTEDIHNLIKKQFESTNATDKASAFNLYMKSSAKDRMDIFKRYEEESNKTSVGHDVFIVRSAFMDAEDVVDILKKIVNSDNFNMELANDQRGMYEVFSMNKRKALLTSEGRDFLKEGLIKLSGINQTNAVRTLDAFGLIDYLEEKHQVPVVQTLLDILNAIDKDKSESFYNSLKRLLKNSPKALTAYEKVKGKVEI